MIVAQKKPSQIHDLLDFTHSEQTPFIECNSQENNVNMTVASLHVVIVLRSPGMINQPVRPSIHLLYGFSGSALADPNWL